MGTDPAPGYQFEGAPALEGAPAPDVYTPVAPTPSYENGGPVPIAGSVTDGDAEAIDSLVRSAANGPDIANIPRTNGHALVNVPVLTRALTVTQTLPTQGVNPPVLLLAADPNRKSLNMRVISATLGDTAFVADDSGKLQVGNGGALVLAVGQAIPLDGHTGPVWGVAAPGTIGPVSVTIIAVTQ